MSIELPKSPSFNLDGYRALVTGGSSGLGLACAVALADAGAEVVIAARRIELIDEVVDAIKEKRGNAIGLKMDIADVESTRTLVAGHGPFQVLVNSAGLARHTLAVDTPVDDFDEVVGINFRGAYFLTTAVARGLVEAGLPGSLINISSQMGVVGGPERAVYCATKHAVEGFTKAMAIELGPHNIRVNTICPTFFRTPLTEPTFSQPDKVQWLEEKIKLGRVGELQDIMGAVVYLASQASAMVTGSALMLDGGWTSD